MATQYTAGLTTGQVLTAATMNSIGAAWETWTPTITASTGTFTTITVNRARYGLINKIVIGTIDFTVTSIGTASGTPRFTLPITASGYAAGGGIGSYRETDVTGIIGITSLFNTTSGQLLRYDNTAVIGANYRFNGTFTYEAA